MVKMISLLTLLECWIISMASIGKEFLNGKEQEKRSGLSMEKYQGGLKFIETYGLCW